MNCFRQRIYMNKENPHRRPEELTCSLCLIYYPIYFVEQQQPGFLSIGKFGCFKKTFKWSPKRPEKMSIDSLEESEYWLLMDEDSKTRKDAFEKCAWCSWKGGAYFVFGLDSNNSCYSGMMLRFTCVVQNFRARNVLGDN